MKEEVTTTPVYSMGVAERLTGLTGRQIRYWEQHGLVTPSRTKGKQRMYSDSEIYRLKEIKRLLVDGMTLDRVKAQFSNRDMKRQRLLGDAAPTRMTDRIPRGASLYTGGNRAELERFIDRKAGK